MANEVEITVKGRDSNGKALITELRQELVGAETRGKLAADQMQKLGEAAQQFLGQAVSAASNLQQAVGGTEAVFGNASASVDNFAKRSAQSAGLSEAAFRDATTLIGGQLKRMTGDVDFAADASIQLVQVGADLAATYGGTTKEAVDAFAAALRGEADPAERFNLNLKISAVNAKAVELGLAESTDAVDDNARAQALLALVMEQSADAQGQFAREADTAAVSGQKAQAAWEDAQAELGSNLLPVLAQAASVVSELSSAWAGLPEPVKAVSGAVVILGAGFLLLAPRIVAAQAALVAFGMSARAANLALGGIGIALTALSVALVGFSDGQKDTRGAVSDLTASLDEQTGSITDQTREVIANRLEREGLLKQAEQLGISTTDLVDAITGEEDAWNRVNRAIRDGEIRFESVSGGMALNEEGLQRLRGELEEAEGSWSRQAGAVAGATDQTDRQIESLKELGETLRAQNDPVFAFLKAQDDLREAQRKVNEAEEEHTRNSPEYRAALRDQALATLGLVDAAGELDDEFDGQLTPAMKRVLREAGFTKGEIRELADMFRQAKRDADKLDGTRIRINETYRRNIVTSYITQGAPPTTNRGGPQVVQAHGGIIGSEEASAPTRAQGGGPRSNTVLVGEQGPEVVELPFGSRVIPSGQSRAMLREARSIMRRLQSGKHMFEDLSWRGSDLRFNDMFQDWHHDMGGGHSRRDYTRSLRRIVDSLEQARPAAQHGSMPFGGNALEVRWAGSSDRLVDELVRSLSFRIVSESGGDVTQFFGVT